MDKINAVSNDVGEALLTSDIYTYRMTYKGEWQEGVTYRHGDVVRHLSGLEIYKNSEHVYYKKDDQEWWEIGNNHTKYYIKGAAFISSDGLSSECIISNSKINGFDVISTSYESSKDTYSEISNTILLTSDTDLFKSGGRMKNEDISSDINTAMYFGDIKVSKLYQGEKQIYPNKPYVKFTLTDGSVKKLEADAPRNLRLFSADNTIDSEMANLGITKTNLAAINDETNNITSTYGYGIYKINAFKGCTNLSSVTLNGCQVIGHYSFNGCSNLSILNVDSTLTSYDYSLQGTKISEAYFPNIKRIGTEIFKGVTSLTSFRADKLSTISQVACFDGCTNLSVFDVSSLAAITGNSRGFERGAFVYGTILNLPNLKSIGQNSFAGSKIVELKADELSNIGESSFAKSPYSYNCYLSVCNFPKVEIIGKKAFYSNGNKFTKAILPSVTSIEQYAFGRESGTSPLKEIWLVDKESQRQVHSVPMVNSDIFYSKASDISVFIPIGMKEQFESSNWWSTLNKPCLAGFYEVGLNGNLIFKTNNKEYSFDAISQNINRNLQYCSLTPPYDPTIPYSDITDLQNKNSLIAVNDTKGEISSIGHCAFISCSNLTSINCHNVTLIGDSAFTECSSLISVDCHDVSSIGGYVFYQCENLTSIDCHDINSIGNYAFYKCKNLSSIECNSINSFGSYTFQYCTNLKSVIISSVTDVPTVYDNTFSNCTYPISVYVKDDETVEKFKNDINWKSLYNANPRKVEFVVDNVPALTLKSINGNNINYSYNDIKDYLMDE